MPKYIVNARIPEEADQDTIVANFASAFNVSEAKARGRLGKLPGRVSKPVTNREARYLAKRFDKIGLLTDIVEAPGTADISPPHNSPTRGGDGAKGDGAKGDRAKTATNSSEAKETAELEPDTTDGAVRMLRDTHDSGEFDNSDAPRPAKIDREAATRALAASISQGAGNTEPTSDLPSLPPKIANKTADKTADKNKASKTRASKTKTSPLVPVRFGVRKKFLLTALAPALIMLLLGLLTVTMRLPPLLQDQQETTSDAVATTLATSIAALIVSPLESPNNQTLLRQWLVGTQAPLVSQGIDAVLVSDMRGQVLAGWLGDLIDPATNSSNIPLSVQATLQAEVARASARFAAEQSGVVLGQRTLPAPIIRLGGREIVLTARVITQTQNGTPTLSGAVIIGSDVQPNQRATRNLLFVLTLLALLPLLLGVSLAWWFGSRMRQVVRGLLARVDPHYADDTNTIPHSYPHSYDELGLLARTMQGSSEQTRS